MASRPDGTPIVDAHQDVIDPGVLEKAAYEYVLASRAANEMHDGPTVGQLVESFVATPEKLQKMGLPPGSLPLGWWVAFKLDEATFAKVKAGKLRAFSIEGRAHRREESST